MDIPQMCLDFEEEKIKYPLSPTPVYDLFSKKT